MRFSPLWKCQKSGTQLLTACSTPLSILDWETWFSLGTSPPKTKLIRAKTIAPSSINFDFLRPPFFWKVLKWPWNCQKLTYFKNDQIDPRICVKVLCVKIWPKKFKRKCPKWPIVIATPNAIRWFKCKLKPPKNDNFTYFNLSIHCIWLQVIIKVKVTH